VSEDRTPGASAATAICDEDEILAAAAAEPGSANGWGEAGAFHRVPPVYFIGDSRVVPFRNAVYVSPYTARAYALRAVSLRSLHAADLYSPETGISAALMGTLATDLAVTANDEGTRWQATASDHPPGPSTAPLVLFCGPYDMHRVLDELGPDADVVPWDSRSQRYAATRSASRLVRADEISQRIDEIMQPLALGIRALRAIGFDRLFVHGAYRPCDIERVRERYGTMVSFRRYRLSALFKVLILLDDALRRIALESSSRYIAGPADADGLLADEFTSDDVHYSARGASELARHVVAVLEGVVE
jgi:hypothetical protein